MDQDDAQEIEPADTHEFPEVENSELQKQYAEERPDSIDDLPADESRPKPSQLYTASPQLLSQFFVDVTNGETGETKSIQIDPTKTMK